MSLDVYLTMPEIRWRKTSEKIFIREDGQNMEISQQEWNDRFPDQKPFVIAESESDEVFSANVTHNLTGMADEAGIYKHLWRPEELNIEKAGQLIEPLTKGLALLKSDPVLFEKLNPENGWGSYEDFVPWVEEYLNACKEYPEAKVRVSR